MPVDQAPADLGAKLHRARECRGVTLRQIADSTNISVSILKAIESNNISRLPGGIFGRGFVRSFATEVGLDPEAAVAEFVAQLPPDSTVGPPPSEDTPKDDVFEALDLGGLLGSTLLRIIAVSVPLASLVLYFGAGGRSAERPAVQRRANLVASKTARAKAPAQSAVAAVSGPFTSPPAPPPAPAGGASTATAPSPAPSASGASTAAVPSPAAPAGGASAAATPTARSEDLPPEVAPADTDSSHEAKPGEKSTVAEPVMAHLAVELSVTRPSWVIATVDGKKAFSRLFEVGDQETLAVLHDLVLTAGDAGAIVMTLNGSEARSLGGTAQTVTARITRANFKTYLPPRQLP